MALTPEDIQQIKDIIAEDTAHPAEGWSWKKFLTGFFNGKNYAKAIVLGVCLTIILVIGYSTYEFIKSRFVRPTATQATAQTIGTNQGQVNTQNESHDNRDENAGFNIINLSNWFKSKK